MSLRYSRKVLIEAKAGEIAHRYDESQSRRHVRMNHPAPLAAAHQVHSLPAILKETEAVFWARVRGADGER